MQGVGWDYSRMRHGAIVALMLVCLGSGVDQAFFVIRGEGGGG